MDAWMRRRRDANRRRLMKAIAEYVEAKRGLGRHRTSGELIGQVRAWHKQVRRLEEAGLPAADGNGSVAYYHDYTAYLLASADFGKGNGKGNGRRPCYDPLDDRLPLFSGYREYVLYLEGLCRRFIHAGSPRERRRVLRRITHVAGQAPPDFHAAALGEGNSKGRVS